MKRPSFDWNVRIGLGVVVLALTLIVRSGEVSILNHLLPGLGVWLLLVAAVESRALGRNSYWHDFAVSRAKLSSFRIAFFSLIAFDAWRQTEHMARYGTNGFNVSHFPFLDWLLPMPTSSGILIVYLLQAYLAARIVLGVSVPVSVKLLTALYGYAYFISQVDSYQHHYFVFLLLAICCFVPWEPDEADNLSPDPTLPPQGKGAQTPTSSSNRIGAPGAQLVKSWAVRLLLVQMAVLYGWAAISKLDPLWLNGEAMSPNLRSVEWMNYYARSLPGELYATPAQLAMLAEVVLALAVATRRLWYVALPAGIGLHVGIELGNFEIGIFSYYMFGMYLLVVPDRVYQWCAQVLEESTSGLRNAWHGAGDKLAGLGTGTWVLIGGLTIGGSALLWMLPFDEVLFVALVAAAIALVPIVTHRSRKRVMVWSAVSHVIACATLVAFFFATDTAHDMYRKLAGSHRRLGNKEKMYAAYAKLTQISPDFGRSYHHMGHVHRERSGQWGALAAKQKLKGELTKETESRAKAKQEAASADEFYAKALAAYQRTHEQNPNDYWSYVWEAILHEEAATRLLGVGKRKQAVPLYRRAISVAKKAIEITKPPERGKRWDPKKSRVFRNARRIIRDAQTTMKRVKPRKRTGKRRRNAPPGQSFADP